MAGMNELKSAIIGRRKKTNRLKCIRKRRGAADNGGIKSVGGRGSVGGGRGGGQRRGRGGRNKRRKTMRTRRKGRRWKRRTGMNK